MENLVKFLMRLAFDVYAVEIWCNKIKYNVERILFLRFIWVKVISDYRKDGGKNIILCENRSGFRVENIGWFF